MQWKETWPMIKDNSGQNNNIKVGWLSHLNEKLSLVTLGIRVGGVVSMFILWERARHWVLVLPHNKPQDFYGEYRFPT